MKKIILISISSLFVVLLALSCINYEQEVTLNPDGSGVAKIHYWMQTGSDTGDIKAPVKEEDIKEEYGKVEGVKVSEIKVEDKEGNTHVYFTLNFDNLKAFLNTELGGLDKEASYFKEKEGKYDFLGVVKGSAEEGAEEMDDFTKSMLGEYKFTYLFHFPGKVLETNGEIDEKDPKTVRWEYSLAEISSKPKLEMKASVEKAGIGLNITLIIIIVVVIIIIIIVVILLAARGSKKE